MVAEAFGGKNLRVYSDSAEMFRAVKSVNVKSPVFLFMSSGDFDGCNLTELSEALLSDKNT